MIFLFAPVFGDLRYDSDILAFSKACHEPFMLPNLESKATTT